MSIMVFVLAAAPAAYAHLVATRYRKLVDTWGGSDTSSLRSSREGGGGGALKPIVPLPELKLKAHQSMFFCWGLLKQNVLRINSREGDSRTCIKQNQKVDLFLLLSSFCTDQDFKIVAVKTAEGFASTSHGTVSFLTYSPKSQSCMYVAHFWVSSICIFLL